MGSIYHQILGVPFPTEENIVKVAKKQQSNMKFTVISENPNDKYHYGIFLTRAVAAIMIIGLEINYKGQKFKVIELTEA